MKRLLYAFLIPLGILLAGGLIIVLLVETLAGIFNVLVYFGMTGGFALSAAIGIILYVFFSSGILHGW